MECRDKFLGIRKSITNSNVHAVVSFKYLTKMAEIDSLEENLGLTYCLKSSSWMVPSGVGTQVDLFQDTWQIIKAALVKGGKEDAVYPDVKPGSGDGHNRSSDVKIHDPKN